jgi:radical SAM PhpK family P-methyltransferase
MFQSELDCIVIGYNELPFANYEGLLRQYGEDSEAYRDLKLSFVELDGHKRLYPDLMNEITRIARQPHNGTHAVEIFKSGDIPNLAAAYLANFLQHRGYRAQYINLFQDEKDRLVDMLKSGPLCIAITTTFYVLNMAVVDMVEFIRSHNSDVKIVVGGPLIANHVRNYSGEEFEAALRDMGADIYVIEGQGELTLAQIIQCLQTGGDVSEVPNLAYFDGGHLRRTAEVPENNSLDENFVNWKGLTDGGDLGPTLQTRTARSCAFKCSFCNYPTRAGALTLASLDTLEREFNTMIELGNVQNIVFIDDTFNVPLPRFKDICRLMIRKNYRFNWFSYFRCSNSDDEAIELMAESGCKGVFLGIESGSPKILKNMNKAATVEKYERGIEMLRRHGVLTFASFITGFPGETEETVRETLDFIRMTKPDYYRTQLWYCEAGTPIVKQRDQYGVEGDGFVWSHNTMDSMEAMEWIERIFLSIKDSVWLPQWSFDFWIIPYLMGKGVALADFREFMKLSQSLMALGIATVPVAERSRREQELVQQMVSVADRWRSVA